MFSTHDDQTANMPSDKIPLRVVVTHDKDGRPVGLSSNYKMFIYRYGLLATTENDFVPQVTMDIKSNDKLGLVQAAVDHAKIDGTGIIAISVTSHEMTINFAPAIFSAVRLDSLIAIVHAAGHEVYTPPAAVATDI